MVIGMKYQMFDLPFPEDPEEGARNVARLIREIEEKEGDLVNIWLLPEGRLHIEFKNYYTIFNFGEPKKKEDYAVLASFFSQLSKELNLERDGLPGAEPFYTWYKKSEENPFEM